MTKSSPLLRYVFSLLLFALIIFLAWVLAPILIPFAVAGVFAYALTPLVNYLNQKWKLPRWLSVAIIELLFILVAFGLLILLIPIFSEIIPKLREQVPILWNNLNQFLPSFLTRFGIDTPPNVNILQQWLMHFFGKNNETLFQSIYQSIKVGSGVAIMVAGNIILIPILLFYFLLEWSSIIVLIQSWIPPRFQTRVESFSNDIARSLGQYVRGQLLVMLVLAIYYSLGLKLIGLDLGIPIGVFTGLLVFVPYVGYGSGLVFALLSTWLQWPTGNAEHYIGVAVIYLIGQVLESFLLTPRLVGERVGLSPLAVLFALFAFGQLFGFVGVLLAIPLSTVGLVLGKNIKRLYLNSKLYQD